MPVVARISAIWSKQKLFVSLLCLGVSLWFLFDGVIKYPRSNIRFDRYHEFADNGRGAEWPAEAKSHGWVTDVPEKRYDFNAIFMQYFCSTLAAVSGALLFVYWFTQRKRVLKLEDGTVYTPTGAKVPFSAIRGLGKKRWESKGIAIVRYEDNGRLLQFVVDDYKYETQPTRQIVDEIEQHLLAKSETPGEEGSELNARLIVDARIDLKGQ